MRAGRSYRVEPAVDPPKEIYGYKVYLLALISSMGALMFGYDLSFIGTVLELESFQKSVVPHGSHVCWGTSLIA